MKICHCERVRAAREGVVGELAQFRTDTSDERLVALKEAIENWRDAVGPWGNANTVEPCSASVRRPLQALSPLLIERTHCMG